jgi:pyruvate dehydrogenase E2 component (dihydrolipoamide acetyltransferase)
VDVTAITGTGAGGTITVEDVEKAAAAAPAGPRVKERRALKGVAAGMAASVTRSWQIPQFVQIVLVDATALGERRKQLGAEIKEKYGIDVSYTDLILDAVVRAAVEVPEANATFDNNTVTMYQDVNVSVAVANEEGLVVVPVIHRAQELPIGEMGQKMRDIAERARVGALTMDDIEGGTITVSNLGMFGIETGTPILTPPQSSLVFIGAMKQRAFVIDGQIVARNSFYMSIAYDHRVLAGATASAFTGAVKRNMESL